LFIRWRKLRHVLIQALADRGAGEHQLGRRRLIHRTIGTMRRPRPRHCRVEIAGELGLQKQDLVAFSRSGLVTNP